MSTKSISLATLLVLAQVSISVAALPLNSRGWQTVPNVIRTDGIESFVVEVETSSPVAGVTLDGFSLEFNFSGGPALRDDGLGSDRVASDSIYTSEPITYNTNSPFPLFPNFRNDPNSPAGLNIQSMGTLTIQELDASETTFLAGPEIGLLRSDIPTTQVQSLSPDIAVSSNLINIRTSERNTQLGLRGPGGDLGDLTQITQPIYDVLPDAFDMLMLFSTNKIENDNRVASSNFFAGKHGSILVDYSGTGLAQRDNTALYGSAGKLLGISHLDTMKRGISGRVITHEILHQWSMHLDPSLGIGSCCHPSNWSNVGSLLGGFEWIDNGDGTYTINSGEGVNEATNISELDAYMMGLTDGSNLGTILTYDQSSTPPGTKILNNEPITQAEIVTTVTLEDIQAIHGVRTPTPDVAQKDFSLGFVAESHERMLTPTEMTFYNILAEHYTSEVPVGEPDPKVGENWVPITRFFGHGTTWSSAIPLTTTIPGDYNGDGNVDGNDFLAWQRGESPNPLSALDLTDWEVNFGTSGVPSPGQTLSVPEPTSLLLFATAILAFSANAIRPARSTTCL